MGFANPTAVSIIVAGTNFIMTVLTTLPSPQTNFLLSLLCLSLSALLSALLTESVEEKSSLALSGVAQQVIPHHSTKLGHANPLIRRHSLSRPHNLRHSISLPSTQRRRRCRNHRLKSLGYPNLSEPDHLRDVLCPRNRKHRVGWSKRSLPL